MFPLFTTKLDFRTVKNHFNFNVNFAKMGVRNTYQMVKVIGMIFQFFYSDIWIITHAANVQHWITKLGTH